MSIDQLSVDQLDQLRGSIDQWSVDQMSKVDPIDRGQLMDFPFPPCLRVGPPLRIYPRRRPRRSCALVSDWPL
eukprot:3183019-Pyramimonas_sp.AAC.1